jgi:hypothetical protein
MSNNENKELALNYGVQEVYYFKQIFPDAKCNIIVMGDGKNDTRTG